MNKEKEYYNYLLRILALVKTAQVLKDEDSYLDIIRKIEELSMEELNYFENVNFNKINYFYKDYIPGNNLRILILIKSKNNEYLFYKNNDKICSLNVLNKLYFSLEDSLNELEEKINAKFLDLKFIDIYLNKPLEKGNDLLSSPEQVLIFEGKIDKINNNLIYLKEINKLDDEINKETFLDILSKINK